MNLKAFLFTLLYVASAGTSFSQPSPASDRQSAPIVTGIVSEVGSSAPVSQVEILVYSHNTPLTAASFSTPDEQPVSKLTTGPDGRFRIQLPTFGNYKVRVKKEGWGPTATTFQPAHDVAMANISEEHPSVALQFWMARPGRVIGRAIDAPIFSGWRVDSYAYCRPFISAGRLPDR